MLDIATQAPQLRSLDLMVHHPEPVEQRDSRFAYPRLERQRIAGDGCTSLIPAPYLRSLTLVDEASMRAVDQLMTSRPFASGGFSIGAVEPLFPQLRSLTFVFGGVERTNVQPRMIHPRTRTTCFTRHLSRDGLQCRTCWKPHCQSRSIAQ